MVTRWRRDEKSNSFILTLLVVAAFAGRNFGVEALTSRMLASLLGYPTSCAAAGSVRSCSLALSCWLAGGRAAPGCGGGWLFACCLQPHELPPEAQGQLPQKAPGGVVDDFYGDDAENSINSWQYSLQSPPKLQHFKSAQAALPNNVFRRRVDDDLEQMDCGLPASKMLQKRIIGGREARFAEFPWQAHVRIMEFQCGGVLISRRFVATAAHCVQRARPRDIAVWLGALDTTNAISPARRLSVLQKILHPLFEFRATQPDRYDIALLRLSRAVRYSLHIQPICLPGPGLGLRGRPGLIAGWGKTDTSTGHTGTNILRSAVVPILSTEQCIKWHQSKRILVEIHSEMICAGHSDGHQDACLGDSGGPLIVLDRGRYYLVGITSAGFGCGVDHQPGIYHNVKTTYDWIKSVIMM